MKDYQKQAIANFEAEMRRIDQEHQQWQRRYAVRSFCLKAALIIGMLIFLWTSFFIQHK